MKSAASVLLMSCLEFGRILQTVVFLERVIRGLGKGTCDTLGVKPQGEGMTGF